MRKGSQLDLFPQIIRIRGHRMKDKKDKGSKRIRGQRIRGQRIRGRIRGQDKGSKPLFCSGTGSVLVPTILAGYRSRKR